MKPATDIGIVADDLTGGAAIAGEMASRAHPVSVVSLETFHTSHRNVVVDTASRYLARDLATARVGTAMCRLGSAGAEILMKKIDSTLKGNVAAELERFTRCIPGPTVIAPACPEVGIGLRNGQQQTRTGKGADVARILSRALGTVSLLPLDDVRNGVAHLGHWFASNRDRVVLADAETQSDLNAIVAAAVRSGVSAFAGTYGLGEALARARGHRRRESVSLRRGQRVTIVVGSSSPVSSRQVSRLVETGAHEVACDADALIEGRSAEEIRRVAAQVTAASAQVTVVHTDPKKTQTSLHAWSEHNGYSARDLAEQLAPFMCAAIEANRADVVVIVGGETTGAILSNWQVNSFEVVSEAAPGIPTCTTSHPLLPCLLTKPGAFGTPDVLVDIAAGQEFEPSPSAA